jgi:head-tail adaptor
MATVDMRLQTMTRRMIAKASGGAQVTFQRSVGLAPNITIVSATVTALVKSAQPGGDAQKEAGYAGRGAPITTAREILVMADDLATQGFSLPLEMNDSALIIDTGERLKIIRVDMSKRAIAGCIEAMGVIDHIGVLRDMVRIDAQSQNIDDARNIVTTWTTVCTTMARMARKSAETVERAGRDEGLRHFECVIPWRADVGANNRLHWLGRNFDVQGAINLDGLRQYLTLDLLERAADSDAGALDV